MKKEVNEYLLRSRRVSLKGVLDGKFGTPLCILLFVIAVVLLFKLSAQQVNPYTQIKGPVPSFFVIVTPTSITMQPGTVLSASQGLISVDGAQLLWNPSSPDSGDFWVGPGFGQGAGPSCFYSLTISPTDFTTTFGAGACSPVANMIVGTWMQKVIVANGVIQPLSVQYIPVPGP